MTKVMVEKSRIVSSRIAAAFSSIFAVFSIVSALNASPATWFDPANGLAMGGYDPVAYFTQSSSHRGRREYEASWKGRIWRFVNTGNRDAFNRNPEAYMPQFSGYDAYAASTGRSTRGHPKIWAVRNDRLYLFFSSANRQLWMQDAGATNLRASKSWQSLSRTIPGHAAASD